MVDIDVVDTAIRATDAAGNRATVDTSGWDRLDDAADLAEPVDTRVTGRANELSFPWVHTWVWTLDDGQRTFLTKLTDERTERQLDPGAYHVTFDDAIQVVIEFDGEATISRRADRTVTVSFPQPTVVTIGFRSLVDVPEHTVTVPRTPEGVGRALSSFAVARRVDGASLSSPIGRGHPPRIRFGDGTDIPEAVRSSMGETGVELRVPDRLDVMFPLASLAFYLGASVTVTDGDDAVLRVPSVGVDRRLGPTAQFQHEAAALLQRVVSLDTLVHLAAQQADLAELHAFETLDLDVEHLNDASLAERLGLYLDPDLAYDRLEPVLPPWHYTMYVDPSDEHVPSLSSLAHRLARIYLPSAVEGTGRVGPTPGGVPDHDGDSGQFTGWLGPGEPTGPFLSRPAAYENRAAYVDDRSTGRVALVVTDDRRSAVVEAASEVYRDRAAYPTEVDVYERATVADLREAVETRREFVHYVGELDGSAFACADGTLSPAAVNWLGRTVLLDAPNSLPAAAALVDRGAVAAIALRGDDVLAPDARRLLLELLGGGMAVDHAVRFVRRYLGATDDLVAVGDGLCQVGHTTDLYVLAYRIDDRGDGTFSLAGDAHYPDAGLLWSPDFEGAQANLVGNPGDVVVDASDLRTLVADSSPAVIVYDGECYWTDDLEPFYPAA
ncbi:hypothetical protein [Halovivax limisalsi]|uniref:hypothetical protein n=1 Tax=Halovivax limisalsi TaxID=1453760 RepID=UPI001FFC7EFC|nr:hypothetical protein [Halovivax limisalsi]